jgi:hypothetical protein
MGEELIVADLNLLLINDSAIAIKIISMVIQTLQGGATGPE